MINIIMYIRNTWNATMYKKAKFINADSVSDFASTKCLPILSKLPEELLSNALGHLGLDIAAVTQAPKH